MRWPTLYDGRLSRPAEVAVDLEAHELVAHVDVAAHELEGVVPVPLPLPGQRRLVQVHADVEHDAGGAHALAVEHAEAVARVIQVAELLHEALRVERPALGVAGGAGELAAVGVELGAVVHGLAELQVVARNALVVHGRGLAPGVEGRDALGHRPPHPARPREVVARARVVDPALLRRRDHALEALDRVGDVEVGRREFGHRLVAELLHPLLERLRALELARRVGVEELDRLERRRRRA